MMITRSVKVFSADSDDKIEYVINKWMDENPKCDIQEFKIRKDHRGWWYGYVFYTKFKSEEK